MLDKRTELMAGNTDTLMTHIATHSADMTISPLLKLWNNMSASEGGSVFCMANWKCDSHTPSSSLIAKSNADALNY